MKTKQIIIVIIALILAIYVIYYSNYKIPVKYMWNTTGQTMRKVNYSK